MALELVWSKRADKKFDKIIDYLLKEWGEKTTSAFIKKVYDFLDLLVEFPEMGSFADKRLNVRGFTIVKQINIYYQIKKDRIIILNFFDNRQGPKRKRF